MIRSFYVHVVGDSPISYGTQKDHSMIETRHLKNVIFFQTILKSNFYLISLYE